MPDPAPNADLLRSLGRLVSGLSALFWGLPIALIVCFYTAKADGLRAFGIAPPLATNGLLVYGLWQLGDFQKQERIWRDALERARFLGLVNLGLSPFLYWYNRVPNQPFFLAMVILVSLTALLFLASLNLVLQRLGAMLPDETLRLETRQFTVLNLSLLAATFLGAVIYFGLSQFQEMPLWLGVIASVMERSSFWIRVLLVLLPLALLVLLPLAMTMALLWKTKEVILDSIFGARS